MRGGLASGVGSGIGRGFLRCRLSSDAFLAVATLPPSRFLSAVLNLPILSSLSKRIGRRKATAEGGGNNSTRFDCLHGGRWEAGRGTTRPRDGGDRFLVPFKFARLKFHSVAVAVALAHSLACTYAYDVDLASYSMKETRPQTRTTEVTPSPHVTHRGRTFRKSFASALLFFKSNFFSFLLFEKFIKGIICTLFLHVILLLLPCNGSMR